MAEAPANGRPNCGSLLKILKRLMCVFTRNVNNVMKANKIKNNIKEN